MLKFRRPVDPAHRPERWRCAHSTLCASVSVAAAVVVALASAVALAVFDKPLDRESFVPSLLGLGSGGETAVTMFQALHGDGEQGTDWAVEWRA